MIADEYCTAGSKDYRGIRENAFRQFKKSLVLLSSTTLA